MSRTLYVAIEWIDPEGNRRARGESVVVADDDRLAIELLNRGVLSEQAPRRQAGENSARVTGEQTT